MEDVSLDSARVALVVQLVAQCPMLTRLSLRGNRLTGFAVASVRNTYSDTYPNTNRLTGFCRLPPCVKRSARIG